MVGIVVVCESRKNTMYLPMPLCGLWVKPCRSVGSGSGERGSGEPALAVESRGVGKRLGRYLGGEAGCVVACGARGRDLRG